MIDFVGRRGLYYFLSLLIMVPGVISLVLPGGIQRGIEFTSGTNFSLQFEEPVSQDELRTALAELGHPGSRIQQTTEGRMLVRTDLIEGASEAPAFGPAPPSAREELEAALVQRFGPMVDSDGVQTDRFIEFSSVSPSVSSDITRNAAFAVIAASAAILVYITLSFISVPNSLRYGTAAIIAMAHDVVVVLGAASILGRIFDFEIDTLFITAMLTIVGFSVHDTIVVFDRVRENVRRAEAAGYNPTLAESVNASLNQTLGRSLNTSITAVLVLVALMVLGGDTIRNFVTIMAIGIISGTYSSIFIASQLLVSWDEGDFQNPLRSQAPEAPRSTA
ncbi:MAG TPA: protein translocase subunit SecF [Dehalococcoidia bacterium]|jgi:preprotein translocase subunit SecF|nr:protein translocase subunit SecF [Dehalococcoidia bacterium]